MIKLFTHTDLDGIGCAVIAKAVFKDSVDTTYCTYDDINHKVSEFIKGTEHNKYSDIYITDISISEQLAIIINDDSELASRFRLLDHHATALNLNEYSWCSVKIEDRITSLKTCGTEMFYKYLVLNNIIDGYSNNKFANFVRIVRDYDTWRWAELGYDGKISKEINDLYYIMGKEAFIDWCLLQIESHKFPTLTEQDKTILDIKQREIDNYIKTKDDVLIKTKFCYYDDEYNVGVVFADKYLSELGNGICTLHPEIDYCMIINMDGGISFRTIKNNINLGKQIAPLWGGGGHAKAAGAPLDKKIIIRIFNEIV